MSQRKDLVTRAKELIDAVVGYDQADVTIVNDPNLYEFSHPLAAVLIRYNQGLYEPVSTSGSGRVYRCDVERQLMIHYRARTLLSDAGGYKLMSDVEDALFGKMFGISAFIPVSDKIEGVLDKDGDRIWYAHAIFKIKLKADSK